MEEVARRCATAVAVLGVGGLIAAAPVLVRYLPHVQPSNVELTSSVVMGNSGTDFLTNLIEQELTGNSTLIQGEQGFENASFGDDGSASAILSPMLDAGNTISESGENQLNGLFGGPGLDPGAISRSLGIGSSTGGGLAGDRGSTADRNTAGSAQSVAATMPSTALQAFNSNLVSAVTSFNSTLVSGEASAVQPLAEDSALADIANRLLDVHNLLVGYEENVVYNVFGVGESPDPQNTLLIPVADDAGVNLLGAENTDLSTQLLAAMIDIAELKQADWVALGDITTGQWQDLVAAENIGDAFTDLLLNLDWSDLLSGVQTP